MSSVTADADARGDLEEQVWQMYVVKLGGLYLQMCKHENYVLFFFSIKLPLSPVKIEPPAVFRGDVTR